MSKIILFAQRTTSRKLYRYFFLVCSCVKKFFFCRQEIGTNRKKISSRKSYRVNRWKLYAIRMPLTYVFQQIFFFVETYAFEEQRFFLVLLNFFFFYHFSSLHAGYSKTIALFFFLMTRTLIDLKLPLPQSYISEVIFSRDSIKVLRREKTEFQIDHR